MYHIQNQSVQFCSLSQLKVDLNRVQLAQLLVCTIRHNSDRLIIKASIGHLQPPLPAADIIARDKKAPILYQMKSPDRFEL